MVVPVSSTGIDRVPPGQIFLAGFTSGFFFRVCREPFSCQKLYNQQSSKMLTESRKRRRCCESEDDQQLNPQAKRTGGGPPLVSHVGRDIWDSEQSSSSDSSGGISSPETAAGASVSLYTHNSQNNYISHNSLSPQREDSPGSSLLRQQGFHDDGSGGCSSSSSIVSYDHINRVLREAHFSSLQTKGRPGST